MLTSIVQTGSHAKGISGPENNVAPQCLGEWFLLRPVAEGTWTTVFQASVASGHKNQPPRYAVKTVKMNTANPSVARDHLLREVEVGRTVIHPHLVPILAWKLTGSRPYIVMPWLGGMSLEQLLRHSGTIAPADAIWMIRQIAEGLSATHRAGWLHADLKPSNVIVNPEGHVTIIDFGFARRFAECSRDHRELVGTLDYMAPEWILRQFSVDHRSDIYSLGVIFFEMLTGQRPYSIRSLREAARVHRQRNVPEIQRFNPTISHEVSRLIRQMMSPLPERRPSSAAEVAERLVALEIEHFTFR